MREHYLQVGKTFSPTPSFFDNEDAGRAFMYLSYWYAGLFVVCEGWQELKLSDPEIDGLLASPNLELLKRFRNGVYLNSPTIDVLLAAGLEPTLDAWLEMNEAAETFDYELLESLPAEFHDEYIDRVRLHSEYEAKFAGRREDSCPVGMA